MLLYSFCSAWMRVEARTFAACWLVRRLHWEHGQGSVWARTGSGGESGGEVADERGGSCLGAESSAPPGDTSCGFRGAARACACPYFCPAACRCAPGQGGGDPGGPFEAFCVEAFRAFFAGVVAGSDGNIFRHFRADGGAAGLEVENGGAPFAPLAGSAAALCVCGAAVVVWILCGEQLCSREASTRLR